MTEAEFEDFIEKCNDELQSKNEALENVYGLGHYANWYKQSERRTLTFYNPGEHPALEASTTSIGTYSLQTHTWLWTWGSKWSTEAERSAACQFKQLYDVTGMRIFNDAYFDCDEYLAWQLAGASVHQLNSLGCYRAPSGHLWEFLSIDSLDRCVVPIDYPRNCERQERGSE
jgi:hypothetical protein